MADPKNLARKLIESHLLARHMVPGDEILLAAADGVTYDVHDEIYLSRFEPLITTPSSTDNVVPAKEVAGWSGYQTYIGSSANPGYRDFAVPALIVRDRRIAPGLSFDVIPFLGLQSSLAGFTKCPTRAHIPG